MEENGVGLGRVVAITAIAPVAWGSTYLVTEEFLPPDRPLFAALMRALPAGLILLLVMRQLPGASGGGRRPRSAPATSGCSSR